MVRRTGDKGPLKAVFVRVGWMTYYDLGREPNGPVRGGSFNLSEIGSEAENFHAVRGRLYGFVQIGRERAFNLRRLGVAEGRTDVTRLLVLGFATPEAGGQFLVGWYDDAACVADYHSRPRLYGAYNFEAAARSAVLLPLNERTFEAPTRHSGGFGQSNVRYPRSASGEPDALPWMVEAVEWARAYRGRNMLKGADPGVIATGRAQGRMQDAEARRAVELRAMAVATDFFAASGYRVQDVHRTHSYDLWCVGPRDSLRVEVKGSVSDVDSVIVTRNEVRCARERDSRTALFVVANIDLRRRRGGWVAAGGKAVWLPDWRPAKQDLDPIQYEYRLPRRLKRATIR